MKTLKSVLLSMLLLFSLNTFAETKGISADTIRIKDTTITVTHTNLKLIYTTPYVLLPTLGSTSFYVISKITIYKAAGTAYTTAPQLIFRSWVAADSTYGSVNVATSKILNTGEIRIVNATMESSLAGSQFMKAGQLVLAASQNPAGSTTVGIKIYIQYYVKTI